MHGVATVVFVLGLSGPAPILGTPAPVQNPVAQSTATAGDVSAEAITFPNGGILLAGTLTVPPGKGPHPAVVLISGSGPQDRDCATRTIPGYRPFALIADHLARQGVAVLRFDDRGVGESSGVYLDGTEQDFINDAAAALAYVRGRPDMDPDKVGILGFSEGAMIAAIVASQDQRLAFVMSLGGPAVSGYDLLLRQAERNARADGMSDQDVAALVLEQRRIFDLVLAKEWDTLRTTVQAITLRRLETLPPAQKAALGDLAAFAERRSAQSLSAFQSERYQFILGHDTSKDWARVTVPTLAIFGELDVQCDAAQNRPALEAALARGGNTRVTTTVIPAANHLFVRAKTGSMSEYQALPKGELAPGTLAAMSDWLLRQRIARK